MLAVLLLTAALSAAAVAASAPVASHLSNGVRVIVQGNEHSATVVVCGLVRVTALHEVFAGPGMRALAQRLVARGDCCRDELAAAGVRVDTSVAPDYVELVLSAPAESMPDCVRLLRRMLFAPQFTQEALEVERARLMRAMIARDEMPAGYTLERFYERLYPNLGAGGDISGDAARVAATTLAEVKRFHARHYLPNATVVAISGGVEATSALAAASRAMAGVLPGPVPAEAPVRPPLGPPTDNEMTPLAGTSVYVVGGRAVSLGSPMYPAAAVGMTALSSGMGSRLYMALRVKEPLAYTIAGELTPSEVAPSAFVLATCEPRSLDAVAQLVNQEIAEITSHGLLAADLQRAKRYLIGRQALRRQRNQDIAHYLALFELLGGPGGYERDEQLAGDIAAVDAAAVTEAMRSIFEPMWAVRLEGRQAAQAD